LTAATLGFYLLTLTAKSRFALDLILLWPCSSHLPVVAGHIGLACLATEWRQLAAGVSLGVMVIKPHRAIAMAVCAFERRWIAVIATTA
jgi:hypothetical protein